MSARLIRADVLDGLRSLDAESVQTCITSPPYWGLRNYGTDGQIGLETTPTAYVERMVEVFREVRRVLRDDGTLWLNIGDTYAGSSMSGGGKESSTLVGTHHTEREGARFSSNARVPPNITNCLHASIKGGNLFLSGRCTLAVTTKREDVLLADERRPDTELSELLGVQRVTIKQGNDDLCQVVYLLHAESRIRVCPATRLVRVNQTDAEILSDVGDHVSIIVTDSDLESNATFGVAVGTSPAECSKVSLTISEARQPVTEGVGDFQPARDAITDDARPERILNVDTVHQPVPLGDALVPCAEGLRDFRVTVATPEHVAFTFGDGRIDLAIRCVRHLLISNAFGSLMRYVEIYDKAERQANTMRPKQELGIPFMVRQALMEDGWICRSTIIWNKPNPMPESVRDRPTKAHEYVFLLSKQPRYFYDADAIREPHSHPAVNHKSTAKTPAHDAAFFGNPPTNIGRAGNHEAGRNKRSVWTVATQPYREAHFATFPEALIEPCVLAGTSAAGQCSTCGSPLRRTVEREFQPQPDVASSPALITDASAVDASCGWAGFPRGTTTTRTLGWEPTCQCGATIEPQIVLDPFAGSGTSGVVALRHGRAFVGIDINPEYINLAQRRISGDAPLLNSVELVSAA